MRTRHLLCSLVSGWAAAGSATLGLPLFAEQPFPSRSVTIVVPAGAGSGPDATARRIAAALSASLGQTVIVDNRAGAAGITGSAFAAHAQADGYTLYMGGRLRALAIAGPHRNPLLPDVPTSSEQAVPGFQASGWVGFLLPIGTPPEIVAWWGREITAAVNAPDFVEWLHSLGSDAVGNASQEFAAQIRADGERWGAIVRSAGLRLA